MADDFLERATRALRELDQAPERPEPGAVDLTRARVLSSLRETKRKKNLRFTWGLPLAAIFFGGVAAAQVSGALPRAVAQVKVFFEAEEPTEPAAQITVPGRRSSGLPPPPKNAEAHGESEREQATEPVEETREMALLAGEEKETKRAPLDAGPEPAQLAVKFQKIPQGNVVNSAKPREPKLGGSEAHLGIGAPPAAEPKQASAASEPAPPEIVDESHALYLAAHQAHFQARDNARALSLWDRYLNEFPRGRFATEAYYNRALCLVRLGRHAEATQALRPFAEGRFGGYRQQEARQLLDALGE